MPEVTLRSGRKVMYTTACVYDHDDAVQFYGTSYNAEPLELLYPMDILELTLDIPLRVWDWWWDAETMLVYVSDMQNPEDDATIPLAVDISHVNLTWTEKQVGTRHIWRFASVSDDPR